MQALPASGVKRHGAEDISSARVRDLPTLFFPSQSRSFGIGTGGTNVGHLVQSQNRIQNQIQHQNESRVLVDE